jgi:3-deoxy-D-manno-octulosonic-acid transferase
LHGPHVSPHAAAFARLSAAGAARQVNNADDIGEAVMALIASDLCATMAVAGWQVLTEGAGVCDRLVDLVCDRLEQPKEL